MDEIEINGQVMLPLGGNIVMMDYVNWQNRSWLVPMRIEDIAAGRIGPFRSLLPEWLLALQRSQDRRCC